MTKKEQQQREMIVAEALTWLKTPYHDHGRIKGAGTDCAMFMLEVFERCGLIPHLELGRDIPIYSPQHHFHSGTEDYLGWVTRYATKVDRDPLPGDIVMFNFGRCASHGSIVIGWPMIINAYVGRGVVYADAANDAELKTKKGESRIAGVYSYWG